MSTRPKLSEAEALEQYRVALENVVKQSEIAKIMSEFGYDSKMIQEGEKLLDETRKAYDLNKTEDDETSQAYANFSEFKDQLIDRYSLDRKKAKIIFKNDFVIYKKLGIDGTIPMAYVSWLEKVKKFYAEVNFDVSILDKLSRLNITKEDVKKTMSLVGEMEEARGKYLLERGESQDATKTKNAAFKKMDAWMSEFYAVAKIALDDNPQLLESLGKFVRS